MKKLKNIKEKDLLVESVRIASNEIVELKRTIGVLSDELKCRNKILEHYEKIYKFDSIDLNVLNVIIQHDVAGVSYDGMIEYLQASGILDSNEEPCEEFINNGCFIVENMEFKTPYGLLSTHDISVTPSGQIMLVEMMRKDLTA